MISYVTLAVEHEEDQDPVVLVNNGEATILGTALTNRYSAMLRLRRRVAPDAEWVGPVRRSTIEAARKKEEEE